MEEDKSHEGHVPDTGTMTDGGAQPDSLCDLLTCIELRLELYAESNNLRFFCMKKSLLLRLQFIFALSLAGIAGNFTPASAGTVPARSGIASDEVHGINSVTAASPDMAPVPADSIWMAGDSLTLQEVTVVSNFQSRNSSPLRLNTIDNAMIAQRATARTYPELMKYIPGIYATAETGSYGDAKINIRGFKQENISVLLNGIPISGLTSGNMFWNNWMGLTDATYAIQVQKGVGGSMLSDNSVGGTINIITATTTSEFRVDGGAHVTDYGTGKGFISLNSGELGKGWSISLLGSYVGGRGYVDRTDVSSWSYMLNVTKRIGSRNTLLFTALGSPERHEQRSTKLSYDEVTTYGLKYNKNWGYRDGKAYNLNRNNYFKPYFTLQHIYAGEKLTMTNSVYLAIGNGGGRWSESKGQPISSYRTEDGLVDWDAAIAANSESTVNILSDYRAGHTQAGAVISGTYRFNGHWKLDAGLHYQYYSTWENERITDLLGGAYWYEDYENNALCGLAGRDPVKHVGDYIRTDNGKDTHHFTAYAMGNWTSDRWDVRLGASVFGAATRRWDRYNYTGNDVWSGTASGAGYSTKAGILFKPAKGHSLYLNGGIYSRLPYPDTWFASGNNTISRNVKNERNLLSELGYRFVYGRGSVEATAYYTYWKNKTLMSDPYQQIDDVEDVRYMITGLDALHYGVEVEANHRVTRWLALHAFASLGHWTWQNDVSANIYDNYTGAVAETINVYSKGLPVGDAPQTQVGAVVEVDFLRHFRFSADWQFNDRMYADFDPEGRTDPDDRAASYRIPSYHLVNASLSWSGNIGKRLGLTVFVNGYNLLDTKYIERGQDGADHSLGTFRGFWGFGRNFNFGLRFSVR